VVEEQHDDGAGHRHEHAVDVEAGHPGRPELVEQDADDDRADDAEHDVEQQALALLVDHLAGDEAGDQPEHDPADDRHAVSFVLPGPSGGTARDEVARGAGAPVRVEQVVGRANRPGAPGRAIRRPPATRPPSRDQARPHARANRELDTLLHQPLRAAVAPAALEAPKSALVLTRWLPSPARPGRGRMIARLGRWPLGLKQHLH